MDNVDLIDQADDSTHLAEDEVPTKDVLDPSKRRRVKHLTGVELARKRARDRQAQHARRQKLAQHIEALELRIATYEDNRHRALQKNQDLEVTLAKLKAQCVAQASNQDVKVNAVASIQKTYDVPSIMRRQDQPADEQGRSLLEKILPSDNRVDRGYPSMCTVEPVSEETNDAWLHVPKNNLHKTKRKANDSLQATYDKSYACSELADEVPKSSSHERKSPSTQPMPRQAYISLPQGRLLSSDSRGPSNVSNSSYGLPGNAVVSNCWQNQPSVYAWQIPTKLSTPNNFVDEKILGLIQTQRHLARTNHLSGEALIGPTMPDLNVLFGRSSQEQAHPLPSALTAAFHELSSTIPRFHDRVAGFLATYRLYQWMIDPSKETYDKLFEWQAPRPSQLVRSHPAWMDTPAWGKFRDMIIDNQNIYGSFEFQFDYLSSILLEWPFDPMDAVCIDQERMTPSPLLEKHLGIQSNIFMSRSFAKKYPEFATVCRFEEIQDE